MVNINHYNPNLKFLLGYTLCSALYAILLLWLDAGYSDELLILLLIPGVYSAYVYPNRIYLGAAVIAVIVTSIFFLFYFDLPEKILQAYRTTTVVILAMVGSGELLFRAASARREAERQNLVLISELQDALVRVKRLSGMLPICSCCKDIRDDSGYWKEVEHYLLEHSEAEFTHSLCPKCAKKLYPEYADKIAAFSDPCASSTG